MHILKDGAQAALKLLKNLDRIPWAQNFLEKFPRQA